MKLLIYIAIMTTSFDIFLAWQISGTVRFCQLVMFIPYAYLLWALKVRRIIIMPKAIGWLCFWNIFILLFVLNTDELVRSVGYWLWLTQDILNIILLVNVFVSTKQVKSLLRVYCLSFVMVAVFGLFQFIAAPFLKMNTPLVAQWWIPGVLARINGFSYEPSYFATYMLMGWCVLLVLLKYDNEVLFNRLKLRLMFCVVSASMILSSSRMGIMMMICVVALPRFCKEIKEIILNFMKNKIHIKYIKCLLVVLVMCFCIGNIVPFDDLFDEYGFLLEGTGIGGTAAHSVDTRADNMEKTLVAFYDNPIIGSSLGGVAEKIAISNNQSGDTKDNEGSAVALEVLAASGIVGIIPFLVYFYKLIKSSVESLVYDDGIGEGLLIALIAEILILQLNQNILRPYFWMHIAVLSVYLRWKKEEKSVFCK